MWKTINGKRYLVMRQKKEINRRLKIRRKMCIDHLGKLVASTQNLYRKMSIALDFLGNYSLTPYVRVTKVKADDENILRGTHEQFCPKILRSIIFIFVLRYRRFSYIKRKGHQWISYVI